MEINPRFRDLLDYLQTESIEAECRKRLTCIVKQIEEEESLSELEKPFEPYKPKWIPDSCKIHGLQVIY